MSTITINWLNKCRCGNKSHTVKTVRGNETGLWDDDAVKCNSCGRGGVIQVCEGQARVLWETDEEMAEGKSMSTITREFTKEQLIARIHQVTAINKYRISRDPDADGLAMDNELLAIALVSFEAEPVCYLTWHQGFRAPDGCEEYVVEAKPGDKSCDGSPAFPVYTAPPAPVSVPAAMEMDDDFDSAFEHGKAVGWNAYRAAMLQGADLPQNEPQNIPENIPATQFKPVADLYGLTSPTGGETSFTFDAVEARDFIDGGWSCQEYVELERFQEAVSGNSPVIPDGWVIVPAEPTAEMLQSGISAHYERNQIQIHDRPAPGPMECAYVAMLAAAPQQEAE